MTQALHLEQSVLRGLLHTRMGKLQRYDVLVRDDAIGTVWVTGLVKSSGGRLIVQYVTPDGTTGEYRTWPSTHARIRAVAGADPLPS